MQQATKTAWDAMGELKDSTDWRVRRRAALELARYKDDATYQALLEALRDRDPDVRHGAVIALGRLGDDRAVETLCRPWVLDDPSVEIRWAAVTALGQLGSLGIASALSRALEDQEWVVRNQALLVLSEFIRGVEESADSEQIKQLVRLLAIADDEVQSLVRETLARRSTRGIDEMVAALGGQSSVLRAGVAAALGMSKDPRAVAPLIAALSDAVGMVRCEAARALGLLQDSRAVEPLIIALNDPAPETCQAAVDALVAVGTTATVPLCTALAHAASKEYRRNIIKALGGIADQRAIVPLLNNLSSTYYLVRHAAVVALTGFGQEVIDELVEILHVSDASVDALIREVEETQSKRLRLRAIRALGELKHAAALPLLRKLMEEPDRNIVETAQEARSKIGMAAWARHGAVIVLGNIRDARAVPALISALADSSEYVRVEAARALAKIRDERAVEPLISVLEQDELHWVRREAATALHVVGVHSSGVVEALVNALQDGSWEVRAEVARALGRVDDADAVPQLLQALADSSYSVRNSAVHALANLERHSLDQLLVLASGEDSAQQRLAVLALVEAAESDVVEQVEQLRDCPASQRTQVVEQLRQQWR